MQSKTAPIGSILCDLGAIDESQLAAALDEQSRTRERIGEILFRTGAVDSAAFADGLARQLGHGRFDPTRQAADPEALDTLPLAVARRHGVLPLALSPSGLSVAMSDPLDVVALDHLRAVAARHGVALEILVADPAGLDERISACYERIESRRNVSDLIHQVATEAESAAESEVDDDEAARSAEDAGVVRLVDQIIRQALADRATDIHIEPKEEQLLIRYRIDGLLHVALRPPLGVFMGLVSRIKILSNLDIAERRANQDGRFSYRGGGKDVDVRVSVIPTVHGEKLVLRLLDKTGFRFSLQGLGFTEVDYEAFSQAIRRPYGMVLLSGPTGSGKSTTLYAGLLELCDDTLNITTVEDPVEYQIAGISQVQVNQRKNVTFANSLRSFLRQDPDVIMVGEIRDQETAEISVRAALTGHMVFSTIHANDAPSTATRIISMGVEPFMAASALTMVAAQRLVRRVCPHCSTEYEPDEETLFALGGEEAVAGAADATWRRGTGCVACKQRGYLGRVAIVERMSMSPQLRQLVAENRPAAVIREHALQEGMVTLRRSGVAKARQGITTLEEVVRVSLADD